MTSDLNRRSFLSRARGVAFLPWLLPDGRTFADKTRSPLERPRIGCIGNGSMGRGDAREASQFGDVVALCDVDRSRSEKLRMELGSKADLYDDYRKVLDRNDVDIVTISTPDHWHTRIAMAACRAGKDVYCQKPLTLTIEEGKLIRKVVEQTGRVFQVGTQQRSEFDAKFLTAVAMVRGGRIGRVTRATCVIGGGPKGAAFASTKPPANLKWDMWLGQAPKVEYIPERCHKNFRWWYEYSGGKMTDWGAHHVDIAQWALGMENTGPVSVEVLLREFPIKFDRGMPTRDDTYNTATRFNVRCRFGNGAEIVIRENAADLGFDNGILFEGDGGKFFVSRGSWSGEPVLALRGKPIELEVLQKLRKGKQLGGHMANFFECTRDRSTPVSDVASHHRSLTTCHLANIALRLGRNLKWDPVSESMIGDPEANSWQGREQRRGYETA
jgi:predicted dehydrogenase